MKKLIPATFAAMFLALACASARAEFQCEPWAKVARVKAVVPPIDNKGLIEVPLSAEVLDGSQADLADLRIIDPLGVEVPWVLRRSMGTVKDIPWSAGTLFNRVFLPGQSTSITVDFVKKTAKDAVRVKTAGDNFRRETIIESSDDAVTWRRVREGGLLFRVTAGGKVEYERDVVTIPVNDQRFMRITVLADKGETTPVEFVGVEAPSGIRSMMVPARVEPVLPAAVGVTEDPERRLTRIELDLVYHRLPLEKLALTFDDANFFRRVTLEGRDTLTHVVRSPRENDKWTEKTVETPWSHCSSGAIFRYSAGQKEDASTALSLDGVSCRYLRLTIHHGDNPPLRFSSAAVTRYVVTLQFPAAPPGPWALYFGNQNAATPQYDLSHFVARIESEGMMPGVMDPPMVNPLYLAKDEGLPWIERHPMVLWCALGAVGLVLAVIILRQAKSLKAQMAAQKTDESDK